jgi:hypothetical protein
LLNGRFPKALCCRDWSVLMIAWLGSFIGEIAGETHCSTLGSGLAAFKGDRCQSW